MVSGSIIHLSLNHITGLPIHQLGHTNPRCQSQTKKRGNLWCFKGTLQQKRRFLMGHQWGWKLALVGWTPLWKPTLQCHDSKHVLAGVRKVLSVKWCKVYIQDSFHPRTVFLSLKMSWLLWINCCSTVCRQFQAPEAVVHSQILNTETVPLPPDFDSLSNLHKGKNHEPNVYRNKYEAKLLLFWWRTTSVSQLEKHKDKMEKKTGEIVGCC